MQLRPGDADSDRDAPTKADHAGYIEEKGSLN
jgi:hypothetical protein